MLRHPVLSTQAGVSWLTVTVAMKLLLTPFLMIWCCRRRHPCCLHGDQHGRMLLHSGIYPPLKPIPTLMTTTAAPSVTTLISLGVHASAVAVGALTCLLRPSWEMTRLMRTSVPHVAGNSHVPRRFRHVLHLSPSGTLHAQCTTLQVRCFGVRNRATRVMTCPWHLPGRGMMCHIGSSQLWRPHEFYENCTVAVPMA